MEIYLLHHLAAQRPGLLDFKGLGDKSTGKIHCLVTVKHMTSLSMENMNLRLTKLIQGPSKSEPTATTSSGADDWCQGLEMNALKILCNERNKQHFRSA